MLKSKFLCFFKPFTLHPGGELLCFYPMQQSIGVPTAFVILYDKSFTFTDKAL